MSNEVNKLLKDWGFEELIPIFSENHMDLLALKNADKDVLKELIPQIGIRIRFKLKLDEWVESQTNAGIKPSHENNEKESDINGNFNEQVPTVLMEGDSDTDCSGVNEDDPLAPPSSSSSECPLPLNIPSTLQSSGAASSSGTATSSGAATSSGTGSSSGAVSSSGAASSSDSQPSRAISPNPQPQAMISTAYPSDAKKRKFYDLNSVLGETADGKKVMALYKQHGYFVDDHHRQMLATAIINHELDGDLNKLIPVARFEFLSEEIVKTFPTETMVVWYDRHRHPVSNKTITKGRLVWKYYNTRRDFSKCGILSKSKGQEEVPSEQTVPASTDKLDGSLLWLKDNTDPWKTVVSLWKETHEIRMARLKQPSVATDKGDSSLAYVGQYPALEEDLGYTLLLDDFDKLHPGCSRALFEEWAKLAEFIQREIKTKCPDFLTDAVYTPEERILLTLLNFSKVFPVLTVAINKRNGHGKGSRKTWRPSKVEIQDAFLLLSPTYVKMQEHLKERRETLYNFGLTLQPLAAVIGSKEEPSDYLVVINEFHYEVKSPLKAVDVLFKCFHALNVRYPPEAEQIWLFLQQFVYNFRTSDDKHFASVKELGKSYESFKKNLNPA